MTNTSHFKTNTLREQIVSGSLILLSGSALTTVINLAYNIVVARSIGPRGFGQTTAVYTLLIILSAVTLSFQIVSAKTVAQQSSVDEKAAVYRTLHRSAWACGLLIALLVLIFRDAIAAYFQLPASVLVSLLALGTAFYIPLGSRRGYIQGTCSFYRLAFNLVIEGAVRLGGSWAALQLGYGVRGVVAANAIAIAIAYLAIAPRLGVRIASPLDLLHALRETLQAIVFFSGQVLINNSDIVLVKHFFPATLAGIYAAVAMVGRVIFAFSSAVVNSTFPLVAGTRDEQRKDLRVIATSLLLVLVTGGSTALGLLITPDSIWTLLFGPGFAIAGPYDVSLLLALYALTTVIYSLSAVIITYEMSYKIANASWVQLAFSIALILGICYFHSSLQAVIAVQLILMMMLLAFISVPFLISSLTDPKELLTSGTFCAVRTVRRVSEDEVIAEFLKSDFHYPAFQQYRDSMQAIVAKPNFDDASENAKRRALLYIRHLSLWKELPSDTEWYEAELTADDLINIRAFPRAQWRKPARGSFSITEIVEGVRGHHDVIDEQSLIKINDISHRLSKGTACLGTLILIGLNESEPLTVLDGNHRLVAALLASPKELNKLRFMCGLSPRMMECCWYNTNLATLFRYGKNMLMNFVRKPKAELVRLLQDIS